MGWRKKRPEKRKRQNVGMEWTRLRNGKMEKAM